MAQKNILLGILTVVMAASAMNNAAAQNVNNVDTTATGVKVYNSRDYRFDDPNKVQNELLVGAIGTMSDGQQAMGLNLEARRIYKSSQNFGWFWGGSASIVQSKASEELGSSSIAEIMPEIGIKLGNKVSFEVAAMAGMGQSMLVNSAVAPDGHQSTTNTTNKWGLTYGAKAGLNFQLSQRVSLGIWARYTTTNMSDDKYSAPAGWTTMPTETYFKDKLSFGVSLGIRLGSLNKMSHVSGDNCWHVAPYAVYSFTDNEGIGVGVEMFHAKRLSYHAMRDLGFGFEQTFGQTKANRVFGKFGFEYLPKGSSSPVILTAGVKAGLGQFDQTAEGATSDGSFSTVDNTLALGVYANAYVGAKIHLGKRVCLNVGVEGGPRTTFGQSFEALEQSDYSGSTSKTFGFNGRATAGISIAF